jgi:hypothetical protein
VQDGSNNDDQNQTDNVAANPSPGMMGPQSQRRLGSVKKRLKRGGSNAKHKIPKKAGLVQMGVDGVRAFESYRDCVICRGHCLKRMGNNVSISHKPNHICCGKNRSTQGSSARMVAVNRHAEEMTARNNLPLSQGQTEGLPSVIQHFEKTSTTMRATYFPTTTTTDNVVFVAPDKEDKNDQQGEIEPFLDTVYGDDVFMEIKEKKFDC